MTTYFFCAIYQLEAGQWSYASGTIDTNQGSKHEVYRLVVGEVRKKFAVPEGVSVTLTALNVL